MDKDLHISDSRRLYLRDSLNLWHILDGTREDFRCILVDKNILRYRKPRGIDYSARREMEYMGLSHLRICLGNVNDLNWNIAIV